MGLQHRNWGDTTRFTAGASLGRSRPTDQLEKGVAPPGRPGVAPKAPRINGNLPSGGFECLLSLESKRSQQHLYFRPVPSSRAGKRWFVPALVRGCEAFRGHLSAGANGLFRIRGQGVRRITLIKLKLRPAETSWPRVRVTCFWLFIFHFMMRLCGIKEEQHRIEQLLCLMTLTGPSGPRRRRVAVGRGCARPPAALAPRARWLGRGGGPSPL